METIFFKHGKYPLFFAIYENCGVCVACYKEEYIIQKKTNSNEIDLMSKRFDDIEYISSTEEEFTGMYVKAKNELEIFI